MIAQCAYCGESFTAKRIDARYCSATCRSSQRRKGGPTTPPRDRWTDPADLSVPDAIWPSDNPYGIPSLILAGMADARRLWRALT